MEQIAIFIFGTIIGSFLNVVILRYHSGETIIKGSSRCFSCGKNLRWYELIPILNFIIQRGRCRNCKSKISIQYPLVEFLTGLIFLLTFLKLQNTGYLPRQQAGWLLATGYYFIIFSILIVISIYDLRHQIIPDKLVYLFDILALISIITNYELFWDILAGIILFSFLGLLWLLSKGTWMGLGDAKLALGIGWLLGLSQGIAALILSFWLGATVGIFLLFLCRKRYNIKSKISFGPFLALATLIVFLS